MKISHDLMGLSNQLEVLKILRARSPISRSDLKKATDISWGTVSSACKELLRKGIIKEVGPEKVKVAGRYPVKIDIDTSRNLLVGVFLDPKMLYCCLIDLNLWLS